MIKDENTRITITIPKEMHKELKDLAESQDRTVSNLALVILRSYLTRRKKALDKDKKEI